MKKALIAALIIGATGFAFAQNNQQGNHQDWGQCGERDCEHGSNSYDISFKLMVPRLLDFTITNFDNCRDVITFDFTKSSTAITSDLAKGAWRASNKAYTSWLQSNQAEGLFAPTVAMVPRINILSNVPGWTLTFEEPDDASNPALDIDRVHVLGQRISGALPATFEGEVGPLAHPFLGAGTAGQGLTQYDLNFYYKMLLSENFHFTNEQTSVERHITIDVTLIRPY